MTRDEIIEIMASAGIYPFFRKNKIYFRGMKPSQMFIADEVKNNLKIDNPDECNLLRTDIVKKISERRTNIPIKKWAKSTRPREMFMLHGPDMIDNAKLIAIILRTGIEGKSAEELSREILNKFGGKLRKINAASIEELTEIKGIGRAKAISIKACFELGRRLYAENAESMIKIKEARDIISYINDFDSLYLRDELKEHFRIILLDIKNKVIDNIEISIGSINASVVDPKEVVRHASLRSASSVILLHNHPSGDVKPSSSDIEITKKISAACSLINVKVIDHIIIGKNYNDYFSFAKEGLI
jgi:DNA repair protein RadC